MLRFIYIFIFQAILLFFVPGKIKAQSSPADIISCDTTVSVPDAVTPNCEKMNCDFLPVFKCIPAHYEMWIYDRWGNMIFYTDDYQKGWDGTNSKKQLLSPDVFVWKIKFSNSSGGKSYQSTGHVSLIR